MNLTKSLRLCAVVLAFVFLAPLDRAEGAVPLIKTRTETYKNVTLVSHNATHVFVQHSRGMATLKLGDLDKEALIGLGVIEDDRVKEQAAVGGQASEVESDSDLLADDEEGQSVSGTSYMDKLPPEAKNLIAAIPGLIKSASITLIIGIIGFILCLHLLYCLCVKLICEKTGTKTGWWIWLPFPLIQEAALYRAARMSPYWILVGVALNLIDRYVTNIPPMVSSAILALGLAAWLILHIVWSVKICGCRGKGVFTILGLIFPLTYPLAFLYLAFSGGSGEVEEEGVGRIRLEPLPA